MPSKNVNLETIAKVVGLDITTVSKILNKTPNYEVPEETREKVFRTANRLKYDFSRLTSKYKRRYPRIKVNLPTEVIIRIKNKDKIFNKGKGRIRNISKGGALIDRLKLRKKYLPIYPFICTFTIDRRYKITGEVIRIVPDSPMAMALKLENFPRIDVLLESFSKKK